MAGNFQIKISPMMYRMNNLVNKIFSDDKFSTLFYGELSDDRKGLFLYANAGHNPPMFYNKSSKSLSYLLPTGPLLGPAPNSRYETDSINFDKGDLLVIYSDGITEAANEKYKFYEEKRLEKLIRKLSDRTSKEIALEIIEDVQKFSTEDTAYQDDKTVVVIKRN
jgi:sigma-B regulation protein RsbU (phosphoserine phosphatase)